MNVPTTVTEWARSAAEYGSLTVAPVACAAYQRALAGITGPDRLLEPRTAALPQGLAANLVQAFHQELSEFTKAVLDDAARTPTSTEEI